MEPYISLYSSIRTIFIPIPVYTALYGLLYSLIPVYTALYDTIHPYTSLYSHIRHYTALYKSIQPLYDTIPLNTSLYGPIRHYTALYQSIQPYKIVYSPIPVYIALYDTIRLYTAPYQFIPTYTTLYNPISVYTGVHDTIQPIPVYTSIYNTIRPYTSLYRHIRHYTAPYQSMQPYTTLHSPIPVYTGTDTLVQQRTCATLQWLFSIKDSEADGPICARPTKHQRTCLLSSTRLLARVLSLSLLKCPEGYISELIEKSKPKSCCLDPLPTRVLKQSTDVLANPITEIINTSLKTGVFPTSLNKGNVQPLIQEADSRLRGVF